MTPPPAAPSRRDNSPTWPVTPLSHPSPVQQQWPAKLDDSGVLRRFVAARLGEAPPALTTFPLPLCAPPRRALPTAEPL
eukprot:gene2501-6655_t